MPHDEAPVTDTPTTDDAPRPDGLTYEPQVSPRRSTSSGFLLDALRRRPMGRRFMSAITALLFLGGSGLFAYPFFTDVYTTQVLQTRLEDQFQTITVQNAEDWTAQVDANPGTALVRLALPSIGIETLVVSGTSPAALRAGAGHYPNTPKPGLTGNSAIAGHRTTYGRPFNRIDEIKPGDAIWVATPIGDFKYVASGESPSPTCQTPAGKATCITHPKDWSVIDQTPNAALTLTSCHPKGSAEKRIILRAYLAEEHPAGTYERLRDSGQIDA